MDAIMDNNLHKNDVLEHNRIDNINSINHIENEINNIIKYTTKDLNISDNDDNNINNINNIDNIDNNVNTVSKVSKVCDEIVVACQEIDACGVDVFNTALHQYLRIDEELKVLTQAIKKRNEIKKQLSETLTSFLNTNKIKNVNLDGSYKGMRLETVVTKTVSGFNRVNVTEALYNELKEEQVLFDKIMQSLSRTSIIKEVYKLKLVDNKQQARIDNKNKNKNKKNILNDAETLFIND